MKKITSFCIIDHGVDAEQYFRGCGLGDSSYGFVDVATGIGSTPGEALEDALEQLELNGWNTDQITDKFSDYSEIPTDENGELYEDFHHYVSVRVK